MTFIQARPPEEALGFLLAESGHDLGVCQAALLCCLDSSPDPAEHSYWLEALSLLQVIIVRMQQTSGGRA